MTDTEALAEAERIVEMFYEYMPHKDVKLTACKETPELIVKMERLTAKQCALLLCDEMIKNVIHLRSNFLGGGWFTGNIEKWNKIKSLIEKM